jgi:hypothetical protein
MPRTEARPTPRTETPRTETPRTGARPTPPTRDVRRVDAAEYASARLADGLRVTATLFAINLTDQQNEFLINDLGKGKHRGLATLLVTPPDHRIKFVRDENGHTKVEVSADMPDDRLVDSLVKWAVELHEIAAYDALFAVLDILDLSMVGEFHGWSEGELPPWQESLVACYCRLAKVSREKLMARPWINFDDMLIDLKADLIRGLCNRKSSVCYDPVMAAKVMLRKARSDPYSGELDIGDVVIEALIAEGITLNHLTGVLGRTTGVSEAHWWGKFERRLADPHGVVKRASPLLIDDAIQRPLPRFSLQYGDEKERIVRVHQLKPSSPIKKELVYILQELATALNPANETEVRALEFEERLLISFTGDDVPFTATIASLSAEHMFSNFAQFGFSDDEIAAYFADHRDKGVRELFSQGLAKLFSRPEQSGFRIFPTSDGFQFVDEYMNDGKQRLARARLLIETIEEFARLGKREAAQILLPPLRSDLKTLWEQAGRKRLDWDELKFSHLRNVMQELLVSKAN